MPEEMEVPTLLSGPLRLTALTASALSASRLRPVSLGRFPSAPVLASPLPSRTFASVFPPTLPPRADLASAPVLASAADLASAPDLASAALLVPLRGGLASPASFVAAPVFSLPPGRNSCASARSSFLRWPSVAAPASPVRKGSALYIQHL